MLLVDVVCLWRFCPRRLGGGRPQPIGRALVDLEAALVEFFCPKCREARWYRVGCDGSVTMPDVVAARTQSRVGLRA